MHARHEVTVCTQHVIDRFAHARHDAHVNGNIRRVGQLDADVRNRRAQRAHGKWHNVQCAALHATGEQTAERRTHLLWRHPVIGRACVFFVLRTNISAVFYARYIRWVGVGQITVRALGRIEFFHRAGCDHLAAQTIIFFLRAIAPDDACRLRQRSDFCDPIDELLVFNK